MTDVKPTIVLVHGAFADGSSWDGVIERLQRDGYGVEAPAIALRGVGADSAYLASVVNQIDGPVLLVGHSYGGRSSRTPRPTRRTSSGWSSSRPSRRMRTSAWATSRPTRRTAS
jgi:hypothetical protein